MARNWLHLQVQGEHEIREYELSETAYEVLPLQALAVFADVAPTPSLTPSPGAAAAPSPSPVIIPTALPALKPPPSEADLKEAEVAALYALHQAQADLGEQIEVVREAGLGVIVRGLVESPERKQRLTEALRDIPLVAARIQTVEEAARQASATPSSRARRRRAGNPGHARHAWRKCLRAASGALFRRARDLAEERCPKKHQSEDRAAFQSSLFRIVRGVLGSLGAAPSD